MKFLSPQFNAIKREKEADQACTLEDLPSRIHDLILNERSINDLFYSLYENGKCSDKMLAEHLKHERNAIRVRIERLQHRLTRERDVREIRAMAGYE
jgi:hypothetical protein